MSQIKAQKNYNNDLITEHRSSRHESHVENEITRSTSKQSNDKIELERDIALSKMCIKEDEDSDKKEITSEEKYEFNDFINEIITIKPADPCWNAGSVNDEFIVQDVPGDGQCFFRSFITSKVYNITQANIGYNPDPDKMNRLIIYLKKLIVEYYDNFGENIIEGGKLPLAIRGEHRSVEEWKKSIFKKEYWGGEIEMIILGELFKVHVVCANRIGNYFKSNYSDKYKERVILTYKDNHYKAVLPLQ